MRQPENIDFAMNNGLPSDVAPAMAEVHAFEALVSNTTKPIVQNVENVAQAQTIVDIAAAIAGGLRELQKILCCPILLLKDSSR